MSHSIVHVRRTQRCAAKFCALILPLSLWSSLANADTTISSSTAAQTTSTDGDITVTGTLSVGADTAVTIDSDNSFTNEGSTIAASAGGVGVSVTAATSGAIANTGTIRTGTVASSDTADDGVIGGPAIEVYQNLGGGISNTAAYTIVTYGNNTIFVGTDATNPADVTIGNVGTGAEAYGIYNAGYIYTYGSNSGEAATAIRVEADSGYTSDLTGGISNAGTSSIILSRAIDADATGISIGSGGIVSEIANEGTLEALTLGTMGGKADAISVEAGGTLNSITNSGTIEALADTEGDAVAIVDASGTLSSIENSGTIEAVATDGTATSIDVSTSTSAFTLTNSGTVTGDIYLGSGTSIIASDDGTITGNVSIASGGTLDMVLSGGAEFTGGTNTGASGTLDVQDATFRSGGTGYYTTTASFASDSVFAVTYDAIANSSALLTTTGTTSFAAGATVDVTFSSYMAASETIHLVDAGTLSLSAGGVGDLLVGGVSAGYNADLSTSGNELYITLSRKTASELGITGNAATMYDVAPTAFAADDEFGAAVGNLSTVASIRKLCKDLLPDLSGAREEQALRVQDISSGIVSSRLDLLRGDEQDDRTAGYHRRRNTGLWAQEAVSAETGAEGEKSASYDGTLYALAFGYDSRDRDGDVWGASFTYAAMQYGASDPGHDNVNQTYLFQLYHALNRGPFYWDAMGSLGLDSYKGYRQVTAGDVTRNPYANWMGYQAGLSTQVGYNLALGPISIRPGLGASYTLLRQASYTEEGGGNGVDLAIDANSFQSFRATAELRASGKLGGVAPYLRGGVTHEFLDATPVADGHFVAGGAFSLEGDALDKDIPFAGLGLGIGSGYAKLNFDYTGQFGDKLTSHQATATFVMKF